MDGINEEYFDAINMVQDNYKKQLAKQEEEKERQERLRKAEALAKASVKGFDNNDLKGTRSKKKISLSEFQKIALVALLAGALIITPNIGKIGREVDYNRQMDYMNEVMPITAMESDCTYTLGEYNQVVLTGDNEELKNLSNELISKGFSEEAVMVLMYNWAGERGLDRMAKALYGKSSGQYLADFCGGTVPYNNDMFDGGIKTLKNVAQDNLTETSKAIKESYIEQSRGM